MSTELAVFSLPLRNQRGFKCLICSVFTTKTHNIIGIPLPIMSWLSCHSNRVLLRVYILHVYIYYENAAKRWCLVKFKCKIIYICFIWNKLPKEPFIHIDESLISIKLPSLTLCFILLFCIWYMQKMVYGIWYHQISNL